MDTQGFEEFGVDCSRHSETVLLLVGFDGASAGRNPAIDWTCVEADLLKRHLDGRLDWVSGIDWVIQINWLRHDRPTGPRAEGSIVGKEGITGH